ncbi:MAG: glycosyltransferase [Anaerolineae bacterium]|nr:glycosyltransferase [Anaerolineae bacterium]
MSPKIAVCIPTFNRANFLLESVQSILAQTFTNFEIFISDNASNDDTNRIVSGFQDRRIHYYRQDRNIGLSANLQSIVQQSLETSNAELIAILSDDDLYLANHLANALNALYEYPAAIYYACPAMLFGQTVLPEKRVHLRPAAITDIDTSRIFFPPQDAIKFLGQDTPGTLVTIVCKRKALTDLFWGPPNFIPIDLLIMTQLMVQGGFIFGNESTVMYRIHETNAASSANNSITRMKFACMEHYAIRYLTQFLVNRQLCTLRDIETHGMNSKAVAHVVPLVMALSSFHNPPVFRTIAKRIFKARRDMDVFSPRFRLARYIGFHSIPFSARIIEIMTGWSGVNSPVLDFKQAK